MKKREFLLLSGIVLLACAISAIYVIFCNEPYNDVASRYLLMARAFTAHEWGIAFSVNQPVIIPAIGGIICSVTKLNIFSSLMLSSSLFYILAIFPLFYFLKYFFKDNINIPLLGCLLYVTAPKIIRWGCTGLLDQGRNFFIILTLALIISFFQRKRLYKSALIGIALAGLSLIRGEGIAYVPIFFFLAVLFYFREDKPFSIKTISSFLKPFLICLFFFVLFLSPRLIQVYEATGAPFIDGRMTSFLGIDQKTSHQLFQNGQDRTIKEPTSIKVLSDLSDNKSPIGKLSIKDKICSFAYLKDFLNCFSRGAYEVYLVLAGVGLLFIIIRHKFKFEMLAPLFLVICSGVLIFFTAVTPRYFTGDLLLIMPFTLFGLILVYEMMKKIKLQKVAIIVLIVVVLLQINNGLDQAYSRSDAYYRLTGEWILSHKNEFVRNNKLIIICDMAQFSYWMDAERIELGNIDTHTDKAIVPLEKELKANNVSLIIVTKKNTGAIKALSACPYLEEVKQPYDKEAAVYKIVGSGS